MKTLGQFCVEINTKNISQESLAELFSEAEDIANAQKPLPVLHTPLKTRLNLDTIYGINNPFIHYWTSDHATVRLASCYRHSVGLELENLNKPNGMITLFWGAQTMAKLFCGQNRSEAN